MTSFKATNSLGPSERSKHATSSNRHPFRGFSVHRVRRRRKFPLSCSLFLASSLFPSRWPIMITECARKREGEREHSWSIIRRHSTRAPPRIATTFVHIGEKTGSRSLLPSVATVPANGRRTERTNERGQARFPAVRQLRNSAEFRVPHASRYAPRRAASGDERTITGNIVTSLRSR